MLNLFSTNIDIQSFITSSRDLRFVYNSVASLSASMMNIIRSCKQIHLFDIIVEDGGGEEDIVLLMTWLLLLLLLLSLLLFLVVVLVVVLLFNMDDKSGSAGSATIISAFYRILIIWQMFQLQLRMLPSHHHSLPHVHVL